MLQSTLIMSSYEKCHLKDYSWSTIISNKVATFFTSLTSYNVLDFYLKIILALGSSSWLLHISVHHWTNIQVNALYRYTISMMVCKEPTQLKSKLKYDSYINIWWVSKDESIVVHLSHNLDNPIPVPC